MNESSPRPESAPDAVVEAYLGAVTAVYASREAIGQMSDAALEAAYWGTLDRAITVQQQLRSTDSGADPEGFKALSSQRHALFAVGNEVAGRIGNQNADKLGQLYASAQQRYGEVAVNDTMFPYARPDLGYRV